VNERSCIFKLISKLIYTETLGFFSQPAWKKQKNVVISQRSHVRRVWPFPPRTWYLIRVLFNIVLHTQGVWHLFQMCFVHFLHLFNVFFLQTCLGTLDRISSTCNIIRDILNIHSLSSQIFMWCLAFPNYMIFQ
jgi:hypothetical protein